MERHEITELHFITPIENLKSILERGILSHDRAAKLSHTSVAMEDVQDIRRGKRVPNGALLHSYANLYLHARNPMMYYLTHNGHDDLVVGGVSATVLDIPDAVLTDGNAASAGTRFFPSPEGLANLSSELVFARYWTDDNFWPVSERKRARNAELLVPSLVPSTYITGSYVDTPGKLAKCRELGKLLPAPRMWREVFFR
jgi:hypothetical protein